MPRIEIVDGREFISHQASSVLLDFRQLVNECKHSTPFQSLEWLSTFSTVKRGNFKIVLAFEGEDLVAAYPLRSSVSVWGTVRPYGIGPSDYLAPLYRSEDGLKAIGEFLIESSGDRLVDLHQIPSDHPFASLWELEKGIEQARCLVLDLPTSFETYVTGLSKSLRYDVRRIDGKALRERDASVIWMDESNQSSFVDTFFELHKARWKSRGLPGAFLGSSERFQRVWMSNPEHLGMLRVNMLVAEGKPIGVVYGMKLGTTMYFYQAGMDPGASALSPGTVLVAKLIDRAIEEGCTAFDFMRGDEPYKRRWKPNRERINYRILLAQKSPLATVGKVWNEQAWRIEDKIRDRVEGKSLKK
ncbi:MAG: GNAT family N-acetyltransferase [Fimbriimonadaceae bacterium]|nr:GNAT family N-acetyltransferase [Fimbriimonadaceae bacterium]